MIEVQDREDAGIRAPSLQVLAQVDALQPFAQHRRGESLHPLVEVAEDDLRHADAAIVQDRREAAGLVAPFEERGAEVHVVQVQRVVAERDVDALRSSAARTSSTTGRTARDA